jgi:hypothetical protein
MQLRAARLCLDCEEVHEGQECPVCLSEAFVYLTRWVPVEERRTRRLPSATNVVPEKSGVARWMQRGAAGIAVLAASRLLWQANHPTDKPADAAAGAEPSEESARTTIDLDAEGAKDAKAGAP